MEHCIADIQYCENLFNSFYDIGGTENGGVTRLGYTEQEDRMHDMLAKLGSKLTVNAPLALRAWSLRVASVNCENISLISRK